MLENTVTCELITYGRRTHSDTKVWCGLENYMIRQQR